MDELEITTKMHPRDVARIAIVVLAVIVYWLHKYLSWPEVEHLIIAITIGIGALSVLYNYLIFRRMRKQEKEMLGNEEQTAE